MRILLNLANITQNVARSFGQARCIRAYDANVAQPTMQHKLSQGLLQLNIFVDLDFSYEAAKSWL